MKFSYWGSALGPLMGGADGRWQRGGAGLGCSEKWAPAGAPVGVIDELLRYTDNRVLKVGLALKDRWPGHEAGQFAFVTFNPAEGPHPFTISSAWHNDGKMFFLIKGNRRLYRTPSGNAQGG